MRKRQSLTSNHFSSSSKTEVASKQHSGRTFIVPNHPKQTIRIQFLFATLTSFDTLFVELSNSLPKVCINKYNLITLAITLNLFISLAPNLLTPRLTQLGYNLSEWSRNLETVGRLRSHADEVFEHQIKLICAHQEL